MFSKLGLANTHVGLAIIHTLLQLPFSVYLMRHAFEAVPKQLEEAAVIDGCGSFQVLWRVLLPVVKAGIVTVVLFAFITSWNEFLAALIFMNKETPVHDSDLDGERAHRAPRRRRLGSAPGEPDGGDRAVRPRLRAPAEVLRLRLPERCGEVNGCSRPAVVTTDIPVAGDDPRRQGRSRLTIRDVARLSNVSVGTVSKALNNSGSLRQETRDRVIAVARELGFRPNDLAQSLHRGQSFTVGLISTDSFGRFTMPIMEGLEACLADNRISVFMSNATDDPEREALHLESLIGKRVDGIVVTARRADIRPKLQVPDRGIPVIYVYSQTDDPDDFCLVPDDEGGAALATEHLATLGRRRIAHVTGPERFEAVRLRREGYRKTLARLGIDEPEGFYLPGIWSEGWGREAVAQLFRGRRSPPDAIFCGNDQIARGVTDGLRERGLVVPDTVSIVGFDNWDVMAEATRPPLTSVDMNLSELGRAAGRHLMRLIAGEHLTGHHRLPCSLVVRESCGARSVRAFA